MTFKDAYMKLNDTQRDAIYSLVLAMLPEEPDADVMPLTEVAKTLGVSNAVIRGMVAREEVRCQKFSRKTWKVSLSDCQKRLRERA